MALGVLKAYVSNSFFKKIAYSYNTPTFSKLTHLFYSHSTCKFSSRNDHLLAVQNKFHRHFGVALAGVEKRQGEVGLLNQQANFGTA